jgi:hypothetical protein
MKNILLLILLVTIFACGNSEAESEPQTSQSPNLSLSPLLNSDTANAIQNQTGIIASPDESVKTTVKLNPEHGQPGHRCDIAVGAPLDSKPVQAINANATTDINNQPVTVNSQPAPQKVAPGMNPSHGQPGHRCDIAVGAPLDSKPVQTNNAVAKTDSGSQSVTVNSQPTPQKVAPGMNPSHGQPGHRCDIAVGAPLDSKPVPPAIPIPVNVKTDSSQNRR